MDDLFQFLKAFEKYSRKNRLLEQGDRIVAAVSGGLDSVVLLFCLQDLQPRFDLKLMVAHLNHGLRGDESDEDEEFVRRLSEKAGLKFISKKVDVNQFAKAQKLSLEMAARRLRYQFLQQVCESNGFTKIATGHHANDQAETVLLNLFRGAGWQGLSGIPVKRGNIIRPLLFACKKELEVIAGIATLRFRTDQSNFSDVFIRNRIRHDLIPTIENDFSPNFIQKLNHFSQVMNEGEQYLREQAKFALNSCLKEKYEDKIILEIDQFTGYFTILQKYVLFHLLDQVGLQKADLSFPLLSQILDVINEKRSGRFVPLASGWQIGVDHSGVVLLKKKPDVPVCRQLKPGEAIRLPERNLQLTCDKIQRNVVEFKADGNTEFCDSDRMDDEIFEARPVQPGDSFFPLGLSHRQKISDFFIDHKIPLSARKKALVLTNGKKIVWLIGYRLDDRFKVTDETKNVVRFRIIHD